MLNEKAGLARAVRCQLDGDCLTRTDERKFGAGDRTTLVSNGRYPCRAGGINHDLHWELDAFCRRRRIGGSLGVVAKQKKPSALRLPVEDAPGLLDTDKFCLRRQHGQQGPGALL